MRSRVSGAVKFGDLTGDGRIDFLVLTDAAEEVVTLERGVLKIYGCAGADAAAPRGPHDAAYLRLRMANHTHY